MPRNVRRWNSRQGASAVRPYRTLAGDIRSEQSANAVQGLRTIPEETSVAAAEGTITQAASVSLFRIPAIQPSNGMEVEDE